MQKKGKSKNIATVVKPVEEPTLDLTSVNLNKVDVEALVKEEERLRDLIMKNLQSDQTVDDDKLENLSTVLLQALHTKDEQLINYALEKDDQRLIDNTVRNLLTSKVPTFLHFLAQSMQKKPYMRHVHLKWLRSLMAHHLTVLVGQGQLPVLKQLKAVLNSGTEHIGELARLKGKMSVVLGGAKPQEQTERKPKVKYVEAVDNEIVQDMEEEDD